jgi:hypothetical protein
MGRDSETRTSFPVATARATSGAEPTDAAREIELWTTRDGREIPLDEMTDVHVANALRVLTAWRRRLVAEGGDDPIVEHLTAAVARFKQLDRDRRRIARRTAGKSARETAHRDDGACDPTKATTPTNRGFGRARALRPRR